MSLSPRIRRLAVAGLFVALAAVFPWFMRAILGDIGFATGMNVAVMTAYFAIAALGLNLIVGYCGLLNLGFAGFLLIGAYTCAILCKNFQWSFWLALPASAIHAALWGIVLGLPTLRLTGDYFAIVTFGFGELMNLTARNWVSVTRGSSGIQSVPRPVISLPGGFRYEFSLAPTQRWAYWYLAAVLLGIALVVTSRLSRSRLGRAWRALREDEVAAEACGIYAAWYKTLAFAISAAFGGATGAFLVAYQGSVHYSAFTFLESVSVLAYLVLGGMGTVIGPVAGTVLLYVLGELLRDSPARAIAPLFKWWPAAQRRLIELPWAGETRWILYGLLLILVIRLRPEGLIPSRSRARELHSGSGGSADGIDGDHSLFVMRNT